MLGTTHAAVARPGHRYLAVACAIALTAVVWLTAAPAKAADLAACEGSSHIAYSPGLKLTPADTNVALTYTFSCVSDIPGAANGDIPSNFVFPDASCLDVPDLDNSAPFDLNITWGDNATSTWYVTNSESTSLVGEVVTVDTGTITSGRFAGATVVGTTTFTSLSLLNCLGTGVTSADGNIVLAIADV